MKGLFNPRKGHQGDQKEQGWVTDWERGAGEENSTGLMEAAGDSGVTGLARMAPAQILSLWVETLVCPFCQGHTTCLLAGPYLGWKRT